jgi:hypothetical protein
MRSASILLGLLVILACMPVSAADESPGAAADGWRGVTVLLDDGWRYREVAVSLDPRGAGLWVRREDGAERLVAPERIVAIYAASGEEITRQVLEGPLPPVRPPRETAPVRQQPSPPDGAAAVGWDGARAPERGRDPDAAWSHPDAALFKVAVGAEAGFAAAVGGWYEGFDPAWNFGARMRLTTHERTYLGLAVRHQDLGTGADYGLDLDARLLVLEGTIGWMSRGRPGDARAYSELGAAFIESEVEIGMGDDYYADSRSDGSFVLRAGLLVPLGEGVALDLNGTWLYRGLIFTEDGEDEGSLLGLHAGLTFFR